MATRTAKRLEYRCSAFYHPLKKPCNLICCKTGSNVSGQTRNIAIELVLQQCCKTSCTCFVARLTVAQKKTKNKTTLHVQHTFIVHFFAVVLHDYNVKLPSYTFCGGNVVFTSVSYRRYIIIFMLFFPRKSSPLFFISRWSSFFVIPVSVDIKI